MSDTAAFARYQKHLVVITEQLQAIELRSKRLESSLKRTRSLAGAAVGVAALAFLGSFILGLLSLRSRPEFAPLPADLAGESLSVQRIALLDGSGKVAFTLAPDDELTGLVAKDTEGAVVWTSVQEPEEPLTRLQTLHVENLTVGSLKARSMQAVDAAGNARVAISEDGLTVLDDRNRVRLVLHSRKEGGLTQLLDEEGKVRFSLGQELAEGANIYFRNADESAILAVGQFGNSAELGLYNSKGERRMECAVRDGFPNLIMKDPRGQDRLNLSWTTRKKPAIFFYDGDGELLDVFGGE